MLGGTVGQRMRRPILDAFEAMNEVLKTRAEALWAERKG